MIQNRLKNILLVVGDIVLLYAALYLTLIIRYQQLPSAHTWDQHWLAFSVLFIVWIVLYYINGLYDLATSNNDITFYNKIVASLALNFALGAAYFYLLTDKLFDIKPQTVFFIFIALVAVFFSLWRYWWNTFVQRPSFLRNVLIIGMNDEAKELIKEIIKKPQLGYRIKAIMHAGLRKSDDLPGVEILKNNTDIKEIITKKNITTVVTVLDPHTNTEMVQKLYEALEMRIQFFDLPTFYEKLTGKIPVTNIGHIWFLENLSESDMGIYEFFKRSIDITSSLAGLLIAVPLFPFIALSIKLSSHGPIFFRQVRTGYLGKPFKAIKFRSMVVDAEKSGPQWAKKNDPRVTTVGRFLRKSRLDELPQLWNVLRGEMSLIGPRPERPEFVSDLQQIIPFYNERHLIKPGLTGWAQINFQYGASTQDALKKLQYDLFYIKNRSLPLDVGIALKTLNIIFSGRGQ